MATPMQVIRSLSSSLAQVRKDIGDTRSELTGVQEEAARTVTSLSTVSSSSRAAADSASASVAASRHAQEEVERITKALDDAAQQAPSKLDELQVVLEKAANVWGSQVLELIEAIKVGAAPVELLIQQFGEARINGETLIEFLRGANLKQYQNEIRDLIREIHSGAASVDDALKLLGESQIWVAKKLKETIDLFRQGKVSFQFVVDLVRELQRTMPDSDFADLAGAIEDALRKGDL